jgi:hypothetical protein
MKKFERIFSLVVVRLFQTFLLYFGYNAFEKVEKFGNSIREYDSYVPYPNNNGDISYLNSNSVALSTGFNGGSIAMGLISCTCLFLIVWIEINLHKRKN